MRRGEAPAPALALAPAPPVAALLGEVITEVDVAAGALRALYVADERFANPAGGVQGGMLGAMLDALTAGLVDATLRPGEVVGTLSLNLQFPGAASPGPLQGRAWLGRRGRKVCFVNAKLRPGAPARWCRSRRPDWPSRASLAAVADACRMRNPLSTLASKSRSAIQIGESGR